MRVRKRYACLQFSAIMLLQGSNQEVYGYMMFESRKADGNKPNHFPKSIQAMVGILKQKPE